MLKLEKGAIIYKTGREILFNFLALTVFYMSLVPVFAKETVYKGPLDLIRRSQIKERKNMSKLSLPYDFVLLAGGESSVSFFGPITVGGGLQAALGEQGNLRLQYSFLSSGTSLEKRQSKFTLTSLSARAWISNRRRYRL